MSKLKIKKEIEDLEAKIVKLKEQLGKPVDLFQDVSNYSDVCELLEIKEFELKDFTSKKQFALHRIENIEKLFNGNWKPDFKNSQQRKYYPYFEYQNNVLVFLSSYYFGYFFYGQVAFYKDVKTSDFIGQMFSEIYQDLIE